MHTRATSLDGRCDDRPDCCTHWTPDPGNENDPCSPDPTDNEEDKIVRGLMSKALGCGGVPVLEGDPGGVLPSGASQTCCDLGYSDACSCVSSSGSSICLVCDDDDNCFPAIDPTIAQTPGAEGGVKNPETQGVACQMTINGILVTDCPDQNQGTPNNDNEAPGGGGTGDTSTGNETNPQTPSGNTDENAPRATLDEHTLFALEEHQRMVSEEMIRELSESPVPIVDARDGGTPAYDPFTKPAVADPVILSSGAMSTTEVDLQFPGAVVDLALTRSYRSQSERRSALGSNWGHNYDWALTPINAQNRPMWVIPTVTYNAPLIEAVLLRRPDGSSSIYYCSVNLVHWA